MRTTPLTIVVGWLVAMGSPCDSLAVVSALELAPDFGPPGSVIRLGGLGFVAGEQYQVRIGGISAAVQAVDDSGVDFVVPAGAATGLVELDHDQQTYTLPNLFVVTRMIDAMLPAGVVPDPALYDVGTWYGDSQPNGGAHTVEVALGATTIVAASAGEADPTLFAIATDETAGVMLNAASTAQALIFLTPGVFVQEPVEAAARLGFIQGRPETAALAALIETELAAGRDYLESTPVELQTRIALLAFITEYTPAQSTGSAATPSLMGVPRVDDFANESPGIAAGYPRDLTLEEIPILRKLESSTNGTQNTSPRGLPIRGVKIGALPNPVGLPNLPVPVPVNPLDWSALLYQLDPTDPLLDTPAKAAALMHSDNTAFDRLNPTPLDRLHVKAKPTFRLIDLTGMLEGVIYSPVADAFVSKTQLDVPADRPGLYIIRAFSGARFPLQAGLVASLPDGRTEARKAMVLNLVLAANDLVGVVAGQVDKSCLTGFVLKLERQLLTLLEREGSQEALSSDTVLLLFLEASKTYIKEYIVKCIVLDKNRKGMSGTGKVLLKQLDISAKIAAGGKLGERIMALGNFYDTLAPRGIRAWVVQSVEDTLVVVGNPWEPMIASFYPQAGYRGAKVRINGRHFSTVPEDNLVTFGLLTTDPENPPAPARAEVLRATSNSLIVRVPEQAQTGAITVAVAGQGSTASTDLPERFRTFEVYPDPVIQSIEPDPPVAGQFMRIHGENFARDFEDQTLDYLSTFDDKPLLGSRQTLLAQVPNSTAANGVKVVIEGRSSNEWPFTAVLPEVIPEGAAITITTLADNETADGDISLREAIKVATGTLGRALTSPPDPRPPGQSYETDHVFVPVGNPPPGAGSRDSIGVSVNILNGTIAVGSPLPPLGSFDSYSLPVTVDGTGVGGNGFEFDGSLKLTMQLDVLRGFGGHGVRLSGGARENTLRRMRVEDCGGDGVRFEGAADNNLLEGVTVLRCLNGMRLTGGDVKFNRIIPLDQMGPMDDNVNFGLRLEAGARLNLATVINVRSNGNGGIRVDGAETRFNVLNGVLFQQANTGVLVNGGPGIWVSAPENVFHTFNCAGNLGDGILLEGPDCYGDVLYAIRSGYDSWNSTAWANQGSGIHIRGGAHRIRIGKVEVDDVDGNQEVVHETSYLAGNRDHGIWIEGTNTRDITLNALAVGWGLGLINGDQMLPNGTHGIAITDGARDVSVGGIHRSIKVRIANQTNGAAIYIAGSQTSSNEVFGCEIGYSSIRSYRRGNKVGIHLSEGAFANVIGRRGEAYQVSEAGVIRNYESANEIRGSTEAGILLESGGDPAQTITAGQQPTGGNVIQNNFISGFSSGGQSANRIGIWIRDGAVANRIGGSNPGERNEINYNLEAGILIDGLQVARQNLANRIVGNQLFRNGHTVADPGTPLAGWFQGMGIGLVNNARGNLIGGSLGTEANEIRQNQVGIYLANAISNSVVGNTVRDSKMGGVVLVDSSRNLVGLRNEIYDNGTAALLLGGITITNGSGNRVIGSYVGARFGDNFAFGDGNEPWGIGIFNSADNRIGDHGGDQSNLIVGNLGSGVLISGAGASGNQVANNFVGVAAVAGMFVTGNEGAGIRLENGANNNRIGGTIPLRDKAGVWNAPAGNRIGKSGTDGVHVAGAATTGNSITYNSIADHASGLGIQNVNGGNGEIPSPTVTLVTPAEVKGTVAAGVPDGSLVQVFSDADDEGKVFVGEGLVAGGAFQIPVAAKPFANINATVTHGITGETSEFSTPVVLPPELFAGLHVARTTNPPAAQDIPLNGVPRITMPLKLTASGGPVQITSLSLLATGTVNEATALVGTRLIRDNDKSGDYSSGDEFLAEPIQFTVDDSTRSFLNLDAVILEGETQHWLVEVELDAAMAGVGETVAFEMPSASYIGSQGLFPGSPIAETGEFVIRSDVLSIVPDTGPITFPDWQAIHFSASELSDPAVSGPLGNADNDLLPNVVEYAYGTDPHLDTADPVVAGEHSDAGQTFLTLTFPLVDGLSDIVYGTDTSPDLIGWTTGSFEILSDTLTNGIHLIQLKLLPPVAGVGSRYYRLNIELIP